MGTNIIYCNIFFYLSCSVSLLNTLRFKQIGFHFANALFELIFFHIKIVAFWFKFQWFFFSWVQLTINQCWLRKWVVYWCTYASLNFDGLIKCSLKSHICILSSLRPSNAYMYQWINHHWFRWWLVAWSAPSHYLNQCWHIVNWTLRNKLQWNHNQKFIHCCSRKCI